MRRHVAAVVALSLAVAACDDGRTVGSDTGDGGPAERLAERIEVVSAHVDDWAEATTIEVAWAAAEAAANHVVGPSGPEYGDRDEDGEVRGPSDAGILPGLEGVPRGFAAEAVDVGAAPDCVSVDVLGGDWSDAKRRWQEMATAIEDWSPSDNTMPRLASHPQRIVGWATLTLRTDDLDLAHEFGGHARLHVEVSRSALTC